ILREKERSYNDPAKQVAENELQETKVSGKRECRRTNNGECTRFCRDDRERDSPAGSAASSQEVIFKSGLFFLELRSKPGNKDQISGNHRKIRRAHRNVDDSMQTSVRSLVVSTSGGNKRGSVGI